MKGDGSGMEIKAALHEINEAAARQPAGIVHAPIVMDGVLEAGALAKIAPYIRLRGFASVALVADEAADGARRGADSDACDRRHGGGD